MFTGPGRIEESHGSMGHAMKEPGHVNLFLFRRTFTS